MKMVKKDYVVYFDDDDCYSNGFEVVGGGVRECGYTLGDALRRYERSYRRLHPTLVEKIVGFFQDEREIN